MRPSSPEPLPMRIAGTAAIPSHPTYAFGLRVRGTLGEMTFREIVELHPLPGSNLRDALLRCAEGCLDCGASCTACADASLSERDVAELTGVTVLFHRATTKVGSALEEYM